MAYRCTEPISANLKLAQQREVVDGPDPVERYGKSIKPRKDGAGYSITQTLIETRGEGGLVLCAPSDGYELILLQNLFVLFSDDLCFGTQAIR